MDEYNLISTKGSRNRKSKQKKQNNLDDDEIDAFVDNQWEFQEEDQENEEILDAISENERHEAQFTVFTTAMMNKKLQVRSDALQNMCDLLSRNCMQDTLMEWQPRLKVCLEKRLQRSEDEEEQCLVIKCFMLAMIQLGSTEFSADLFDALSPHLNAKMIHPLTLSGTHSACAEALALGCFIIRDDKCTIEVLTALEKILRLEDKVCTPKVLRSALSGCSLLLTLASVDLMYQFTVDNYDRLMEVLKGSDTQLCLAAGEAFALICENLKEADNDYCLEYSQEVQEELYKIVKQIINPKTSTKKGRGKDRHNQELRSRFSDILATVDGQHRSVKVIKFSVDHAMVSLDLCNWKQNIRYNAYARVLGCSVTKHLASNSEMRSVLSQESQFSVTMSQVVKTSKQKKKKHNPKNKWRVQKQLEGERNFWCYADDE